MSTPKEFWQLHAMAYSFFGNCLLQPLTENQVDLLADTFWQEFPFSGTQSTTIGLRAMIKLLQEKNHVLAADTFMKQLRVEYAQLFLGPPRPMAAPWETIYRAASRQSAVYGEPTIRMKRLLASVNLKPSENNQLPDHIGMELLYIAATCDQFYHRTPTDENIYSLQTFITNIVLDWYPCFCDAVTKHMPNSFYSCLVQILAGCLQWSSQNMKKQ